MQQTKTTCDLCKKEVISSGYYNSGYKRVELKFTQYNVKNFDLCPECLEKHGLTKGIDQVESVSEQSTSDKLYEIIAQIVAENTQQ